MNSKEKEITDNQEQNKEFFDLNRQALSELLTFIDFVDAKLNIGLVEINFPEDRECLINSLLEHPKCEEIQFKVIDLSEPELRFVRDEIVAVLRNIKIEADKKFILLIKGVEKSIGAWQEYPDVLTNLNFVRDELRTSIPHPIIFFLPEYAITRMAKYAPDFWAWNRNIFKFKTMQSNLSDKYNNLLLSKRRILDLEVSEKQKRIEILLRLLSEYNTDDKQNSISSMDIYNELGIAYRTLGKYKDAIDYSQKSLKLAQKANKYQGILNSLLSSGNTYDSQGEYRRAIECYQKTLVIAQHEKDKYFEGLSLNNLANTYTTLENYQLAINYLNKSLEIAQQIGNAHAIQNSLGNIGILLYKLGELDLAIDYYQQALIVGHKVDDKEGITLSLNNLGSAYLSIEEYEKAISCQQQSLNIARQIEDPRLKVSILNNLGNSYMCLSEYDNAVGYFCEALHISQSNSVYREEAYSLFNLGIIWKELKKNQDAELAFTKAKKIF